MALWDWIEANCPDTHISGLQGHSKGPDIIQLDFGSDDEEILFRMRWTMPGSGEVR
jgi:hypothetical protein